MIKNNPPTRMDQHEKMRIRAAAFRATRVLPGAIGELLSREFLTWEEFGYRLGQSGMILRAVDEIMKAPLLGAERPAGESAVGYGS